MERGTINVCFKLRERYSIVLALIIGLKTGSWVIGLSLFILGLLCLIIGMWSWIRRGDNGPASWLEIVLICIGVFVSLIPGGGL